MKTEAVGEAVEEDLGNCLSSFLDNGSKERHRYYLARRTLLEMLKDRGFAVPNARIDMSLQEFRDKHGQMPDVDELKIYVLHKDNPSIKWYLPMVISIGGVSGAGSILWPGQGETVREIRKITEETLSRLILVVENTITPESRKLVDTFPYKVENFQITDLLVNIKKHELKPKHQVLTNEEKEELLKKYSIEEMQLPRMTQKDAIARYYGLEKGHLVKVTYDCELTQLHVTYRCAR